MYTIFIVSIWILCSFKWIFKYGQMSKHRVNFSLKRREILRLEKEEKETVAVKWKLSWLGAFCQVDTWTASAHCRLYWRVRIIIRWGRYRQWERGFAFLDCCEKSDLFAMFGEDRFHLFKHKNRGVDSSFVSRTCTSNWCWRFGQSQS